ncbi:MAG: carboxypeptidase regulatory-like domain-containing protein [Gemmatimonadetes bacterium]|nr:carboxypeptidase regulatory-like domain-containing protein [Gemmatimonadota bacterium]
MVSFRIPSPLRGLAAVAVAVVLAACGDAPAPSAVTADARLGIVPPKDCNLYQPSFPNCQNNGTVPGDGVLAVELLEVCKVWAGNAPATDVQVRLQVRGGTTMDTVFTIRPDDGKTPQGALIQCKEIWFNGSATPTDFVTVTELTPNGYATAWTAQTRARVNGVGTTPVNGPVQNGTGATAPEFPIGGATIDGALITFTNTPLGSIGDRVWNDVNGDGVQDSGEAGLTGWTVTLSGPVNASTTTGANGTYSFPNLPAGNYTVCVTPQGGYTQTYDLDGIATANCATAPLAIGQNRDDVDFGYRQLGSIGDRVWNDLNGDGVQDNGEAGLTGWTVTLSGPVNASTTTGTNGTYSFPNLPAGNYTVCVTPAQGYAQTYDLDGIATANCAAATLGDGQNRTDVDFGYRLPPVVATASLGDRVWLDANSNGVQDSGETGLTGWTVTLTNLATNATTSQVTGANGIYSFAGLVAGNYRVCVTPLAGYTQTYDLDGIATANCATAALAEAQSRTDVDFGYVLPLGSIGDRVWNDVNGNGVQDSGEPGFSGWTVTLTNLATNATSTRTTGSNGIYSFTGLAAGNYRVCVTMQNGYAQTYDLDGIATANCAAVTLAAGQNRTDVDFGYWCPPSGSIGNRVWKDLDKDGKFDSGEWGLKGYTVTLKNLATNATRTDVTDSEGLYGFGNLGPGTYQVCVAITGYAPTYDLDGIATPNCATATLTLGQDRYDVDFGYNHDGSLGDRVWNDVDGDKVQDSGEAGLVGWTVTLTNLATNATTTKTTGTNGSYKFDGLYPGNYKVCVTPAVGYSQTYDEDGLTTPHCASEPLSYGEDRTDFDFGYRLPSVQANGSIGNRVWKDLDKDGVFDSGEWGLQGFTVTIKNLATNATSTDVTDSNGHYEFKNLAAGNYQVCVAISGYAPTFDRDGITTPNCATVTLAADQNRTDVDFGYNHDGSLGGKVWHDADGDKQQDWKESGLSGWTVTLTNLATNATSTKTTSSSGTYKFDGLYPGNYKVCVTPASGFSQTYDRDGLSTPHCHTETVSYGEDRSDINFGYKR